VALILLVAGVALSPFWAPEVTPLLPWGERPATSAAEIAALATRVAALEKRPVAPVVDTDAFKSMISGLGRRVDELETTLNTRLADVEKRPLPPKVDVEGIMSAQAALTRRVDQLESARASDPQATAVAGVQAGMSRVEQRISTIEAQSSARAESGAADIQKLQQETARLAQITADLANRMPALERQVQSQSGAERTDAALSLLLLQMREAVEQGRPFPAEYGAFKSLSRDTELASAAEPLAEPARNGVASRAVLSKRLAELAGPVATAAEPAGEADWGTQALARLRSLVTIRRIEGAAQTGPEAAVSAAQTALARGDLAGAVALLEPLSGANADAARPWLRMARERLSAERALDRLQELLTVRLGGTPLAPAAAPAGAPANTPAEPAKARSPS
jgi:hypothetical protein